MKNLNLDNFGVQEMDAKEMTNVEGGWWQAALTILGAAIYLYNEGPDFVKGFKEGYHEAKHK